jgi:hypothetical protein
MKDESPVLVPEHYITLRAENIKGQISGGKKGEEIPTVQSGARRNRKNLERKKPRPTRHGG